jgi:hypothetical protein
MPSFGGFAIFGRSVSMMTETNPRDEQRNAFPGISGTESLDLGLRLRVTEVSGVLAGVNVGALNTAERTFDSYNDGVARVLVDNFGNTWLHVKLHRFQPVGRVLRDTRGYYRHYKATFVHLG